MNITFLLGHMVKERDLILYELAMDLGKKGDNVTIVSGYPSRRLSNELREYYINNPIEYYSNNIVSIRVGSKSGEGNTLFVRMLKYLFLSYEIYKKAKDIPTDVYYIYSTPPFLGYYSKMLSHYAPVLYNAQDIFPDSLIKVKNYKPYNLLIVFLKYMEKLVYNGSNKIVTISNDMKLNLIKKGVSVEKISVIHNWADINSIRHINRENNRLFDDFELDRKDFYISYAGDIGLHQNLDLFLDVAEDIQNEYPRIKFVFIGNGAYAKELNNRIKKHNLKNVLLYPLQSIDRISEVYSLGNIEIVSLEHDMTKMALPSKVWSIMAAGSPILALVDKDSELEHIIEDNHIGKVVNSTDKNMLKDAIIYMYHLDQKKLRQYGINAREYVENNNSRIKQTEKYLFEIHQLYNKWRIASK